MPSSKKISIALPGYSVLDCPFLYHTKTILSRPNNLYQTRLFSASTTRLSRGGRGDAARKPKAQVWDDLDPDVGESTSFLKQKAAQVASSKPKLGPSITASEQAAFDSIWALFKKPPPSTSKTRATSADHTDTDYKNILELFSSLPQPESGPNPDFDYVETITENNLSATESSGEPELVSGFSTPAGQRSPESTSKLNREGAMAEIRGFLQDKAAAPPSTHTSTGAIQSTSLKIVEDVADSLTTALASTNPRPDIAMWKVAQEKIFPLIHLLRPSTSSLISPPPTISPNTTESEKNVVNSIQSHPLISSDLPLLPLLSQTYPSLTLLILRLYATHHPASPYALSLLPTLKSLGPTSYVLGAHTHFYNALLSIYWRMYSDLRGMNGLLTEMEANGIDFDVGTWEALGMIEDDRQKDMDSVGERGQMWWEKGEQRVWWQRVGVEWREVIKSRLQEKGLMTSEVWREESGHGRVPLEGDRPDYVVTL